MKKALRNAIAAAALVISALFANTVQAVELPRVPSAAHCGPLGDVAHAIRALARHSVPQAQAAAVIAEMYDQMPADMVPFVLALFKHAAGDKRSGVTYGSAFTELCYKNGGDMQAFFGTAT